MKKSLFILLALFTLVFTACEDKGRWTDNDTAEIYFPKCGFTLNDIWSLSDGQYEAYIGIYCGGVRPDNQNTDFTVSYVVDKSIVDAYNADITQQYSGQVEVLPEGCYTLIGNEIKVKAGEVQGQLPIRFNVDVIRGRGLNPDKYYAIPLRITSTEKYSISADPTFVEAMYAISVNEPRFYFHCNRNGVSVNGVKLIHGSTENKYRYGIAAYGVPSGSYNIKVAYDKDALETAFPGSNILPEDAFELESTSLVYKSESNRAEVVVSLFPDNLDLTKSYYLPITITECSPYVADAELKTLFVKVDVKNEYDKSYSSNILVDCDNTGRTGAYSVSKEITGVSNDVVELQMCTNGTIAGASATATSSTTYNNKYMRLKIIPTDNKKHYNVEMILVTDKAKSNNSPATLELIPDQDSYYDWEQERFVLNYRWQHTDKTYINVTEVLQAK